VQQAFLQSAAHFAPFLQHAFLQSGPHAFCLLQLGPEHFLLLQPDTLPISPNVSTAANIVIIPRRKMFFIMPIISKKKNS
jgi:hypothetical protein